MKFAQPLFSRLWPGVLLLLLALVSRLLGAAGLATDDSVPAGFESLAGPRALFVDVIFNDRLLGSAAVLVEEDKLTFDEPELIVAMLDTVVADEALITSIASTQATHVDRLCFRTGDPVGCGSVEPKPFALILDEDALEVTLFVDPVLQQIQSNNASRYLSAPQRRATAMLSLNAAANSFGGAPWEYDLRGEGWFGYGPGYLRSTLRFNAQENQVRLSSLALVHRLQNYEVQVGTYSFAAGTALSSFDALGLRVSTTLQTRIDPEHAQGSELTVLLDRRALVKLFVDGRLYSTQSLDAGHVVVDTADLPDGSMIVETRILDPVSGERTEYHRFTRSTLLPPPDQNAMVFAIGSPLKAVAPGVLPDVHDIGIASFRIARRMGERTAAALGFVQLDKLLLLQPEFILLNRYLTFQVSTSLGLHGQHGLGLRSLWRRDSLSATVSGEWFSYGSTNAPARVLGDERKSWLPQETGQLSLSLDSLHGKTSLGLYGAIRQESDGEQTFNTDNIGLRVRRRFFERSGLRSSLSFGLRSEHDQLSASMDFRLNFAARSRTTSLLLGAAQADSSRQLAGSSDDENLHSVIGYETRWRTERNSDWYFEGGLLATNALSSTSISLDAGLEHQRFSADIQSQRRKQDSIKAFSDTAVNLSTQLVIDRSGFAFAGNDAVRAGFIVDVEGEPVDAVYDIIVNSAKHGIGRVGTPAFIALPPFAQYEIELRPRSLLASTLEQERFEATLYPGNVLRLTTKARHRRLLIATVVDVGGELLSNAVVQRDQGPLLIGTNGLLQVETSQGEIFKVQLADESTCEILVPTALGDEEVVVLDAPLVCR